MGCVCVCVCEWAGGHGGIRILIEYVCKGMLRTVVKQRRANYIARVEESVNVAMCG